MPSTLWAWDVRPTPSPERQQSDSSQGDAPQTPATWAHLPLLTSWNEGTWDYLFTCLPHICVTHWTTLYIWPPSLAPGPQNCHVSGLLIYPSAHDTWKSFFFFFFKDYLLLFILSSQGLSCNMWDLVPWPGVEPRPPALGAWSLSHWSTREVPWKSFSMQENPSKPQFSPGSSPALFWRLPHQALVLVPTSVTTCRPKAPGQGPLLYCTLCLLTNSNLCPFKIHTYLTNLAESRVAFCHKRPRFRRESLASAQEEERAPVWLLSLHLHFCFPSVSISQPLSRENLGHLLTPPNLPADDLCNSSLCSLVP